MTEPTTPTQRLADVLCPALDEGGSAHGGCIANAERILALGPPDLQLMAAHVRATRPGAEGIRPVRPGMPAAAYEHREQLLAELLAQRAEHARLAAQVEAVRALADGWHGYALAACEGADHEGCPDCIGLHYANDLRAALDAGKERP